MNNHDVLLQLQDIFRVFFDDDNLLLKHETSAGDIDDWDSLAQINIILLIEKQFKVKFQLSEVSSIKNVGDIVNLIKAKVN